MLGAQRASPFTLAALAVERAVRRVQTVEFAAARRGGPGGTDTAYGKIWRVLAGLESRDEPLWHKG